jgi:hypothetical protein
MIVSLSRTNSDYAASSALTTARVTAGYRNRAPERAELRAEPSLLFLRKSGKMAVGAEPARGRS